MSNVDPTKQLLDLLPQMRAGLRAVTGHFSYSMAEAELVPLLCKEPAYIATVRDPVAKFQSAYAYLRAKYEDPGVRSQKLSVLWDEDINVCVARILDGQSTRVVNGQCLRLAAAGQGLPFIKEKFAAVVTPEGVNPLLSVIAAGRPMPYLHHNKSNSAAHPIRKDLADRLRAMEAADCDLVEWAASNQDQMLQRAAALR